MDCMHRSHLLLFACTFSSAPPNILWWLSNEQSELHEDGWFHVLFYAFFLWWHMMIFHLFLTSACRCLLLCSIISEEKESCAFSLYDLTHFVANWIELNCHSLASTLVHACAVFFITISQCHWTSMDKWSTDTFFHYFVIFTVLPVSFG